jgi:hypothetical protein
MENTVKLYERIETKESNTQAIQGWKDAAENARQMAVRFKDSAACFEAKAILYEQAAESIKHD